MLKKVNILFLAFIFSTFCFISFQNSHSENSYSNLYLSRMASFYQTQNQLLQAVEHNELASKNDLDKIINQVHKARREMKGVDIWLRYIEPLAYKKINSPLPIEWETEVFEKFEKPYKRIGAGLTLAELYIDEDTASKDSLMKLIQSSIDATKIYTSDSISAKMKSYDHFYLANRLFLLNLATIYTSGFECPDTASIVPELNQMLANVKNIYSVFNESFPQTPFSANYISLFDKAIAFANNQPKNYTQFDHFTFIKEYVNPLYAMNQEMIVQYKVVSKSNVDYSLNKTNKSIFNKSLYYGQNPKGIFLRVTDKKVLNEIDRVGKLLFYDPLLSANNKRSCVSCHQSKEHFTDTSLQTSLHFDANTSLARNTPSLINVGFNHLIMMDGKHISLQNQTKAVITNPIEMGSTEKEVLTKVLSCKEYKQAFQKLLTYTPLEKEITFDHLASAITLYYSKFSDYYSDFDNAMNENKPLDTTAKLGFNIFMGKAQCATCHFAPQFNGVKPSYIGSEFEVLGVPADINYKKLSSDKGRYEVNSADETHRAFRTGTLRNIEHTKPYMHNGVFTTLEQVIDFYDGGGGAGRGLEVKNQTLSSDSLHLSATEKKHLVAFMKSLNEHIIFEETPNKLPISKITSLNNRKVGGEY